MNETPKCELSEPVAPATPAVLECAFFYMEGETEWHAKVTWKCPVCDRRNRVLARGLGKLSDNLPIIVRCKLGHETPVKPYRT